MIEVILDARETVTNTNHPTKSALVCTYNLANLANSKIKNITRHSPQLQFPRGSPMAAEPACSGGNRL